MTQPFTDIEQQLLDVWRRWPLDSHRDRRLEAFLEVGLSEVRATMIVNRLLSEPAAYQYDPVTVARLRRLRDSRVRRAA